MFWQNTGEWESQYEPEVDSYIGSGNDGGDDPQIGYAAYDFETWIFTCKIPGVVGTLLLTILSS